MTSFQARSALQAAGKRRDHRSGEPLDIDTIGDALVIKEGDVFLFTNEAGEVRPEANAGFGLYHADTRYLSEYRLLLQGEEPIVLLSTAESGYSSEQVLTNRRTHGKRGHVIPPQTLQVRRTRVVDGGLRERIEITNHGQDAVVVDLNLRFQADFSDIFTVRGLEAPLCGEFETPIVSERSVQWRYCCLDDERFHLEFRSSKQPAELSPVGARYEIELEPQVTHVLEIQFSLNGRELPGTASMFAKVRASYEEWQSQGTHVVVDDRFFQQAVDRSMNDVRMLLRRDGDSDELLLAAGTPWFDALFGRDSVIASLQMLAYRPEIARGTLRLLARYQGRDVDPFREEQPGKILHERRSGELARTEQVPFGHYFGSIDATPLFLVLFSEYLAWTNDRALAAELAPNVDAALDWVDRYGDRDGDGYIEYAPSSEGGLVNQGWKDSHDGIIDEQGGLLQPPVALVEAQAYLYAALTGLARTETDHGNVARAARSRERATSLQGRFVDDFWLARERFLSLALDGDKQPSHAITSNAGHALWSAILPQASADVVARRLFSPELFSGWGIRTLSTSSPRYNPMGYHLGTVWPHDNALIGMGLKRYGHDDALVRLTTALFDAARAFPYFRLPELFCGQSRVENSPPVPYPIACRPQAWAAGTLPYLLQALLGLWPDAANRRLVLVRPTLPPWLNSVRLENLRVGDGSVALLVERQHNRVEVRVIGAKNLSVEVVQDWPMV